MDATQRIISRHDEHMSPNYPRFPVAMVEGAGCELFDAEGRAYLDLFAGFGASLLGHAHPDLVEAVSAQAKRLWHAGNVLHTEPQTRLAEWIGHKGFGGRSFFCHSGADANETAIKLARRYGRVNPGAEGPRYKILATEGGFHGRSFATMMATGQEAARKGFEPHLAGFDHVRYGDPEAMAEAVDETTVAVLVEPIQGEGGLHVPDEGYLTALRRLCDAHDLLLIVDEVWTGCGRTGRWFAHQHAGITPDALTLAKGVGGGLPVGVCCMRREHAELFDAKQQGGVVHATTLGGNCLAMAAGEAVFRVIERDGLLEQAAALGARAHARLERMAAEVPGAVEARGRGLFQGVKLDPSVPDTWFESAKDVVRAGLDRGLILGAAQDEVVRIAPPLTITTGQLDDGLDRLEALIRGA